MKTMTTILIISVLTGFLMMINVFSACTGDDDDEPTPTPTATPTITPTPTPTGNAPQLVYPVDNEHITGYAITFDWNNSIGSTHYWLAMYTWYPAGEAGAWVPLWDSMYQESDDSQMTLTRDDIWFYWQNDENGWVPGNYAWAVQGDTSTAWSEWGYFSWTD